MQRLNSFLVATLLALSLLSSQPAFAQETIKDLAAKASNELRLLTSFETLNRAVTGMDRMLTYGIVSSTGGWGVLEFVDTTTYENSSVIRNAADDLAVEAARANAAIQRSKAASDEEKANAEIITANLKSLFEAAPDIANAMRDTDYETARILYRDRCQTAFQDASRLSQSSILGLQKRLGKTILSIRTAK